MTVLLRLILIAVLGMLSREALGGFYGHIDTRIQRDSYFEDSDAFIEEYAEIRYVDEPAGIESGMSLAFRQDDDDDARLYQLYLKKRLQGLFSSLRVGRFERSDNLGFYTLDGALLDARDDGYAWSLYAGQPKRIDDFDTVEGDALYGFDLRFDELPFLDNSSFQYQRTVARIGVQRLEMDDVHEPRLNMGLSLRGETLDEQARQFGMDFDLVYLPDDSDFEEFRFELYSETVSQGMIQVDFDRFNLNDPYLSFTDRFYSLYVLGRQTVLSLGYLYNPQKNREWEFRVRDVMRQQGENGYGLSLAYRARGSRGEHYRSQLDYLDLDRDRSMSLYTAFARPVSALTRTRFSGALQRQDKWLGGSNNAIGVEANIERMLCSKFYVTFSGSYIENTDTDDDYLFSLNLSYRFEGATGGWADD